MIVDRNGRRIDAAPRQIVVDYLNITGSPSAVNGISCIACHRQGVVTFEDDLLQGLEVEGEARELAEQLIPTPEDLAARIESDRAGYLQALEEVLGPFLKTGKESETPIESFPEPIRFLVRRMEADLDAQTIASELGMEDPIELFKALAENEQLQALGLKPLLHGERISRDTWRKAFKASVGINQGVPVDISL